MAIFLRNYAAFNDIISYDEASGNWHRITAEQKNVLSSHDISGFFAMLSSKFCGIYSLGRDIFICVGDLRVALNEKIKITYAIFMKNQIIIKNNMDIHFI